MLGLAASHLSLLSGNDSSIPDDAPYLITRTCSSSQAAGLTHRIKSISLLNASLSIPCSSPAEGDARFASILILAFQASCLPDGMTEFLSMIRLCSVIAEAGGDHSIFKDLANRGYSDSMRKMTAKTKAEVDTKGFRLEPEQERLVEGFLESLGRLRKGLVAVGMRGEGGERREEEKEADSASLQMRILEGLEGAARTGRTSPAQG